ncbi:hypothetical protein BB8028_0001g09100 [Beauveria bassiana]|uniref:Secreted protein n=1 Tax=Beauveria bassiana TaxID=176275 RepID=A0A2S7XYA1_BEABA|nr:hypothetical protein BB8028_0001g09100 [Beauveria bassiana]
MIVVVIRFYLRLVSGAGEPHTNIHFCHFAIHNTIALSRNRTRLPCFVAKPKSLGETTKRSTSVAKLSWRSAQISLFQHCSTWLDTLLRYAQPLDKITSLADRTRA